MVSQQTLAKLPDVETLRRLCQSLAMLDAILCREWEYRYSSFNSRWSTNEMLASMRNGAGDEYFILFHPAGAILKGFDHESAMNKCDSKERVWSGVLDAVPDVFQSFLEEPAFSIEFTTFCTWRQYTDSGWQIGNIIYPDNNEDADGSDWLLFLLDESSLIYRDWAKDYYEQEVNLAVIEHIYQHKPLTDELISVLAPEVSLEQLTADIEEINYPSELIC